MALVRRYGGGLGTTVGITLRPITGDPALDVLGIKVVSSNLEPRRSIRVEILVEGNSYVMDMVFWDETYQDRTDTGGGKEKHDGR